MAHGLRYYKELTHADGKVVRLELLQKDYAGASMEIGPVCQSLRLDIQGDTEIDAPIVKTSLSMTFVDAPDHADAKTKKCGNWEEFYTSDATKWKVVMKYRKSGGASFVTMWGGYITPDSYTETLVYRGSVTIIARDNIGHMQDFPFDAEGNADGLISLKQLISGAWAKIESPMSLVLRDSGDAMWMYTDGVAAYDTMMNVSAFKDKNWLEALEDALYSYGVVMRYVGDNNVSIMPLRSLPLMGEASFDDVPTAEPVFMTGAERELTPAVRRIEETQDVETGEHYYNVTDVEYSGAVNDVTNVWDGTSRNISYPLIATSATSVGWYNRNKDKSLAFNATANTTYLTGTDKETILAYPCILAGVANDDSYSVSYGININSYDIDIHVKFGRFISRGTYTDGSTSIEFDRETVSEYTVRYAVRVVNKGITYYLSQGGSLVTRQQYIETVVSNEALNIPLRLRSDIIGETYVAVDFYHIEIGESLKPKQVLSISVDNADARPIITSNHVNTNYKSDNNVVLSRDPQIVPALSDVALPDFFINGIFRQVGYLYESAKLWAWPDGSTAQQMAVYNHLQLLCYHAKPNNVLRGTIVNADVTDMQVIWLWHGAEHMFVSGSFNLLSGHIENAVLREFARYEDMWGLLDPADLPDVDGKSVTNVESGSASKSEGARNTINTEVYLGGGNIVLDDYMSDSSENGVMNRVIKAYVDNLWHLDENGNLVTDKQVLIKNNLIIDGDTSSGGEGEDTPASGIRGIYVNGTPYTDTDGDGFIDLGTISGGVSEITASMITSALGYTPANGANYLPLSGGTIKGDLYLKKDDWYQGAYTTIFRNASASADYGTQIINSWNGGETRLILSKEDISFRKDGINNTLIHSGNIGSQSVLSAQQLAHSNGTVGAVVNSSGNVTIGSSDLAGTSTKLYVNGTTRASAFYSTNIGIECDANGNTSGHGSEINRYGANLYLQNREGNLFLSHSAGTTYIRGAASITGAVTMSSTLTVNGDAIITGDTSSGSDIRFKDIIKDKTLKIEHIAKAPLFTFKWNDRDDDTIHLGSSAQYWEKVCPWLVTGEDFKSLNYATLGVAMGISLAKKAVNHEKRIKELEKEIKRLKEEMRYGDR